jgi:hypothetical protein
MRLCGNGSDAKILKYSVLSTGTNSVLLRIRFKCKSALLPARNTGWCNRLWNNYRTEVRKRGFVLMFKVGKDVCCLIAYRQISAVNFSAEIFFSHLLRAEEFVLLKYTVFISIQD